MMSHFVVCAPFLPVFLALLKGLAIKSYPFILKAFNCFICIIEKPLSSFFFKPFYTITHTIPIGVLNLPHTFHLYLIIIIVLCLKF